MKYFLLYLVPPSLKNSMVKQLHGIETEIYHNLRTCGDSCTKELILYFRFSKARGNTWS